MLAGKALDASFKSWDEILRDVSATRGVSLVPQMEVDPVARMVAASTQATDALSKLIEVSPNGATGCTAPSVDSGRITPPTGHSRKRPHQDEFLSVESKRLRPFEASSPVLQIDMLAGSPDPTSVLRRDRLKLTIQQNPLHVFVENLTQEMVSLAFHVVAYWQGATSGESPVHRFNITRFAG